jgi:hypothetical protein
MGIKRVVTASLLQQPALRSALHKNNQLTLLIMGEQTLGATSYIIEVEDTPAVLELLRSFVLVELESREQRTSGGATAPATIQLQSSSGALGAAWGSSEPQFSDGTTGAAEALLPQDIAASTLQKPGRCGASGAAEALIPQSCAACTQPEDGGSSAWGAAKALALQNTGNTANTAKILSGAFGAAKALQPESRAVCTQTEDGGSSASGAALALLPQIGGAYGAAGGDASTSGAGNTTNSSSGAGGAARAIQPKNCKGGILSATGTVPKDSSSKYAALTEHSHHTAKTKKQEPQ